MRSPFKFLDAFTLADKDVFFGRDREIKALYDMVFRTSLTLVHGMSGTGKTSLVQCGLAACFDGPEWYPFFIRRNKNNLNASLRSELAAAAGINDPEVSLEALLREIFEEYLSPIYLIFDQFEELLILGEPEEQNTFAQQINALLQAGLPLKIVLIMREEYLGHLYPLEQIIPTLFDYRMRVEPMSYARVAEVLEHSFERYNISMESPKDERIRQIIDNISNSKSGIELPYLQVYLHTLYCRDFLSTYEREREGNELPPLEFTRQEITDLGRIDNVLAQYLAEQIQTLQNSLQHQYRGEAREGLVSQVLDLFVSEKGTKVPLPFSRGEDGYIYFDEKGKSSLSPELLTSCIEGLETRRLLRFNSETIELAHDSLAALINELRSDEQRQINETQNRLNAAFLEWERTGDYLSRKQLNSMEEMLPKLGLLKNKASRHLYQFVQASYTDAKEREDLEEAKRKAEYNKEKLLRENAEKSALVAQRSAQKARRLTNIAVLVAFLALGLAIYSIHSYNANLLQSAKSYRQQELFGKAIETYNNALYGVGDEKTKTERWQRWISIGDSLKLQSDTTGDPRQLLPARELYRKAFRDGFRVNSFSSKIKTLQKDIENHCRDFIETGDVYYEAGEKAAALEAYRIADSLDIEGKILSDRILKRIQKLSAHETDPADH